MLCFSTRQICLFSCSISFSWQKKNYCRPAGWKYCLLFISEAASLPLLSYPENLFTRDLMHTHVFISSLLPFFLFFLRLLFQKLNFGGAAGTVEQPPAHVILLPGEENLARIKGNLYKVLASPVVVVFVYIFLHVDECSAK